MLFVGLVLWELYKYPVCPKCHNNSEIQRVKGKIICWIHGMVCILLFFCAVHSNAEITFEFRKNFLANLPECHNLVRLAPDVDIYVVTAESGWHIYALAKKLGIDPVVSNRKYSGHAVAFPRDSPGLKQLAEYLAKGDGIITLHELREIYPKWE